MIRILRYTFIITDLMQRGKNFLGALISIP